MKKYRVWLGTLGAPVAEADSYEEAIAEAIAEVREQGGIGDGPHQFKTEGDLVAALEVEEVDD